MRLRHSTLVTNGEREILVDSLRSVATSRQVSSGTFVELGVKRADTSAYLYTLLSSWRRDFSYYGVDVDQRSQKHWEKKVQPLVTNGRSAEFVLASSEVASAAEWALRPLAWVFIDACHCFECVNQDIDKWGSRIVPFGHVVVHDTTGRRLHYEKLFQHRGTRKFGVYQAVRSNKTLKEQFKKIADLDDRNGIQVYERVPYAANGNDPMSTQD